jgi:hypothetical protein
MPKKKFSPNKLSRQFLTENAGALRVRRETEVPVPAFGDDMTVNVRGLTVADKNLLALLQQEGRDVMSVIAALCAVDDDGALVFGESKLTAVDFVETLPEHFRMDIAAISTAALRLSGRPVAPVDDVEETAVEDAEKN